MTFPDIAGKQGGALIKNNYSRVPYEDVVYLIT
jgi:hypothetical protein